MDAIAGRHLERIARGGSLGIVGAAISAVGGFVVVALITNAFSKADAGALFSATSLFLLISSVAALGIGVGLGRFVMKYIVEKRWSAARACLRNTAVVTIAIGVASGAGLFVLAQPIAEAIGLPSKTGVPVLRILAFALPFGAVANWALSASRAMANIRQTVAIEKVFRALLQLGLVALCVVTPVGLAELTWAWVLPTVLSAPLALLGLRTLVSRTFPPREPEDDPGDAVGEFWKFTWPRSIAQVSQMVIQRADIIIIGALLSPAAAAIYTAATRFAPLGQLAVQAIQQVVQPRFTQLLATEQMAALGVVFKITTAWNIALSWPIYLSIGALPGLYLSLFGDGYIDDGGLVVITMTVAMLIGVASGPVDTLLLMSGRSALSLINSLVALAINLGLNFALIPIIGIAGAAIAWCVAIAVRSTLGYFQVRAHLRIGALSPAALFVGAAAIVCFAAPLGALNLAGSVTVLAAMLVGFGGIMGYAFLLWWKRDLLQLRALKALLPERLQRRMPWLR